MLRSMTGFGRAILDSALGRLTVEINSVNRKYLEVFVSLPKEFSLFEHLVRKIVASFLSRGQISVRIYLSPTLTAIEKLLPDATMLQELKKCWDKVAQEAGVSTSDINLPFLMEYMPQVSQESSESDYKVLESCLIEALALLMKMKETEGEAIARDLSMRINELEKMTLKIEALSTDATIKMKAKLFEKMEEALNASPDVEERLFREVALFAEKVDIAEEITRFRSHIDQFKSFFKKSNAGKKMDFLLQEMGREVNTIGSKSMDSKISHLVVEMKAELEKIREQVQNIE